MSVKSPCIDVCTLDQEGVCLGCKRTKEEIRDWMKYTDEEKLGVIKKCEIRKQKDDYDRYV
ncbi:MAG: DUF1289 domain-containing protein [Bacteroidales bacterium]